MSRIISKEHRFSIAPMMDWTDRHCRYFHRLMSPHALLYSEMITAAAVIHGGRERLLGYDTAEHPIALQLGGSDRQELALATQIAVGLGYDEINLNVGCPSDRVRSGRFGAILMHEPALVADCCAAMIEHAQGRVLSVKCRIGVDEQIPEQVLPDFLRHISDAGVQKVIIHARKAWLAGLSPKDNRTIPPLDYKLVHQMKRAFPNLSIHLNGGLDDVHSAHQHIKDGLDGVMFGRAAYHDPYRILCDIERYCDPNHIPASRHAVVMALIPYIENHINAGGKLHHITRHILGLFAGQVGGRHWRRALSSANIYKGADHHAIVDAIPKEEILCPSP